MNKLLPGVRFNSYFGDWDKNKLKNLASFSKGKGYTKSDLTEQGQPIILYGRLYTKYEAVINSVDTFAYLKDNSVLSEGDEVIVPGSGETSEDISRASVIGESGIIIGGDLNVIKPTKKINSIFLALTISNGRQQKELSKRAQGNSVVHLYNSNLKEVSIIFPEKEEQEKIGSFFNKLDKTITLQQQLLNDHKQLKKAMLQKMIPQKEENVPRVRFAGFTDDWKKKKLKEIGKTQSGIGFPEIEQGGTKGIPFYKVSDMNIKGNENKMEKSNNYVNEKQINKKRWKPIEDVPAIIFAKVGAAIMLNRKRLVYEKFFIDNNVMAYIFNDNWDVNFGQVIFSTLFLPRYAQVGALPSFNSSDIDTIEILIPVIEEQEKIGNYFKKLDEIISLHEQKLETYQELKKAMLQKMFV